MSKIHIKKIRAIANAPQRYNTDFLGKKKAAIKQTRIRQTPDAGKSHNKK
ncbi:hypothetical protein [Succinatimonas hippei]|nr:hypothetical protein [Succinatimonas hippei]MCL1602918.1 hypothetical protein [Succinatimonas hippei]